MFKRLSALLWSRKEIFLANKQTAVMLVMPAGFTALYAFMFKGMPNSGDMILGMVLPLISAMLGNALPTLIAEEAEKGNQQTLILSGVKVWEYVLSSLIIPFVAVLVYLIALPFALKVSISNWVAYVLVNVLTALVTLLIFMAVALSCETQARATLAAMPVMLVSMLLPMMSLTNPGFAKWVTYSHMGAYTKWNTEGATYRLMDKSFVFLLIWFVLATAATLYFAKKKHIKK